MLKIDYLVSGGIITNYNCSSKCRHCVYACSPNWPKDYLDPGLADGIFSKLKLLGCHSVHIGGGEPLLQPERLFPVLELAKRKGVSIEYIETNASWFKGQAAAEKILLELTRRGVRTLLISIDPFHNEYIPFSEVKGLIEACRKTRMGVFPWLMDFWHDLDTMDDSIVHSLEEYTKVFGQDYILSLPGRYGLNLKGRALQTYRPVMRKEPFERIIKDSIPCGLLSGIYHFHIDLYGNFIPQSCPGLSVSFSELVRGADPKKYAVFHRLDSTGIKGLADYAIGHYDYKPKPEYSGKCDLCNDIRSFLVMDLGLDLPDLQPTGHYRYV